MAKRRPNQPARRHSKPSSTADPASTSRPAAKETSPSEHFWPSKQNWDPMYFEPQEVCIGPKHRKCVQFQKCKWWKEGYLRDLSGRVGVPTKEIVASCFGRVYHSLNKIKACYAWREDDGDDAELANMMVMDGCFLVEFLLRVLDFMEQPKRPKTFLYLDIMHDVVLLGNQIPFFVLNDIFECTVLKFKPGTTLVELVLPFLLFHTPFKKADFNIKSISTDDTPHHILSLLHHLYKPQVTNVTLHTGSSKTPSAQVLDILGLKFKPNDKDATWGIGMEVRLPSFMSWDKPTLKMPVFRVDETTEYILINLMAYEQSCAPVERYTSSFVCGMGMLVKTKEDVAVLEKSRVLVNYFGSHKEVADMMVDISKECEHSLYEENWKILNKYFNGFESSARGTYFSSRWIVIVVLVGIIIFAFTRKEQLYK